MILAAPVLAVLLSLPQCYGEPRDVPRLALIADAIAAVSDTRSDAAALLAIGTAESAWCESVHSGRKRGGLGEGLWQLEPGSHRAPPFAGLSLADTTHAAGEALWLWQHTARCIDTQARFGAYAGLGCHRWAGARQRANLYVWALWRLSARAN